MPDLAAKRADDRPVAYKALDLAEHIDREIHIGAAVHMTACRNVQNFQIDRRNAHIETDVRRACYACLNTPVKAQPKTQSSNIF